MVRSIRTRRAVEPFWKLWAANALSNLGDGLYQFALPVLAASATRSPALVSGVTVTLTLAWPLFGLHAGAIVDRSDRRRVLLLVNSMRLLALAALTVLLLADALSLPILYAAAAVLGVGETLADTALTSLVPAVVPDERLDRANGRILAGQTVTNTFVGPPLAGALLGLGSVTVTTVGTAVYGAASAALASLRGSYRSRQTGDEADGAGGGLTEGFRFLWRDELIRRLTLFTAAMNVWWAAYTALIVLYAVDPGPMGLRPFGYGLLLTAMAAGGVAGSLAAERLARAVGVRTALVLDLVGTVLLLGVPAATTVPWLVGAAAAIAGLGAAVWVVLVASIRQRLTPGPLLGRVYSASRLISWGVLPLGAGLGGMAAEVVGIRAVFGVGALATVALLALFPAAVSSAQVARARPSHRT